MSHRTKTIIHFLLIIALLPFLAENYLIARHYQAFPVHQQEFYDNDPFGPLLCWTNLANMKKTELGEEPLPNQENVDSKGRRYNGKDVVNPEKHLLFLGCSYTFGLEISDEDTFVYKTSQYFPKWQFDNYAVPGYGTHQCRIMLEKLLQTPDSPKYDYVFYAFMNDHPHRVAYEYSYMPDQNDNNCGIMPYADLSWNGKLSYHERDKVFIPGATIFRTCAFFNNLYAARKSIADQSIANRSAVYNAVLDDMLHLAQNNNLDLSVLLLDCSEFTINQDIIDKGLNVYDLTFDELYTPKYHVNNDIERHPNGLANEYWAEKLREILINKSSRNIHH